MVKGFAFLPLAKMLSHKRTWTLIWLSYLQDILTYIFLALATYYVAKENPEEFFLASLAIAFVMHRVCDLYTDGRIFARLGIQNKTLAFLGAIAYSVTCTTPFLILLIPASLFLGKTLFFLLPTYLLLLCACSALLWISVLDKCLGKLGFVYFFRNLLKALATYLIPISVLPTPLRSFVRAVGLVEIVDCIKLGFSGPAVPGFVQLAVVAAYLLVGYALFSLTIEFLRKKGI